MNDSFIILLIICNFELKIRLLTSIRSKGDIKFEDSLNLEI
jgi:hypothetical protein